MKKVVSLILAFVLMMSIGTVAFAETGDGADVTEEQYFAAYQSYKEMYRETYKPAYHAYNDAIRGLVYDVRAARLTTVEEFNRIKDFVAHLKATKKAFFGDRVTPGTSRYEVPMIREAMFAAERTKNYNEAYVACLQLTAAVEARIGLLGQISYEIKAFKAEPGETTDADYLAFADALTAAFNLTGYYPGDGVDSQALNVPGSRASMIAEKAAADLDLYQYSWNILTASSVVKGVIISKVDISAYSVGDVVPAVKVVDGVVTHGSCRIISSTINGAVYNAFIMSGFING